MTTYGINYRPQNEASGPSATDCQAFDRMQAIGLKAVRITFPITGDRAAYSADRYLRFDAETTKRGLALFPVLQTDIAWETPAAVLSAKRLSLYDESYERTFDLVNRVGRPTTFELGNEVNLATLALPGLGYGQGQTIDPWHGDPIWRRLNSLKAMHDAIRDCNDERNTKHRVLLTTTTTHFGFLDLAREIGIDWDVTGYHTYDREAAVSYASFWNGSLPPFDLFAKLRSYGRPICIGEYNAGEVYVQPYQIDQVARTFSKMTDAIDGKADYAFVYCMYDQPDKAAPENAFGVYGKPMWDTLAAKARLTGCRLSNF